MGKLGQAQLESLLLLQEADMGSKGTGKPEEMAQFPQLRQMLEEILGEAACFSIKDLAVNGRDLQQLGLTPGPDMGKTLNWLLAQVQDEVLSNDKDTLLDAAKTLMEDTQ